MPARRMPAGSPLPARVVVDSSFMFEAFLDQAAGDGRHEASRALADRFHEHGTVLVVSPLLYLEAPQCWRRLSANGSISPQAPTGDEAEDRARMYTETTASLRQFTETFVLSNIGFNDALLDDATQLAGRYNLRAHDALVVALCRYTDTPDLVALDRDFTRVDGINLWQP